MRGFGSRKHRVRADSDGGGERKREERACNRRETEIGAHDGMDGDGSERESIANKRKQRVIDFCRGFARRYPLYPRLCRPAGDIPGDDVGRRDAIHRLAVAIPQGRR